MHAKYGQNFLTDKNIAERIVNAASVTPQDTVIEIGPGKGIITEFIARKTDKIIAVEIDKKLVENLKARFPEVEIINDNILDVDLKNLLKNLHTKIIFIGNLPYYISTAIVKKVIPLNCWKRAIFTFQKEVAKRITAIPSEKEPKNYGYLTVFCGYYANSKILFDIPPGAFYPRPKVMSAVVEFTPSMEQKFDKRSTEIFLKLIETAFSHRRKTILNNFSYFTGSKEIAQRILDLASISSETRPEKISLNNYKKLTEIIRAQKHILTKNIDMI